MSSPAIKGSMPEQPRLLNGASPQVVPPLRGRYLWCIARWGLAREQTNSVVNARLPETRVAWAVAKEGLPSTNEGFADSGIMPMSSSAI